LLVVHTETYEGGWRYRRSHDQRQEGNFTYFPDS